MLASANNSLSNLKRETKESLMSATKWEDLNLESQCSKKLRILFELAVSIQVSSD